MKILAIETSSATSSIAVAENGKIIDVRRFVAPRGRGAEIFTLLEKMRPTWSGMERMAIGVGQGPTMACALPALWPAHSK